MTYSTISVPSSHVKGLRELVEDCEHELKLSPLNTGVQYARANATVAYYSKLAMESKTTLDQTTYLATARELAASIGIELPPDVSRIQAYVNQHGDLARRKLEEAQRKPLLEDEK